jgi:4-hydroxy-tetrahydrodipicolinate synthase
VTTLRGIIPPVATPLDEQERVHEASLRKLLRHLQQAGVHGLFLLGSTGEFAHLTDAEKQRVLDIAAEEVAGKIPLLVGATEAGTKRCVFWLKEAERVGATAVVIAPPFYYPLSDDEVERHFRSLAEETALPLLLYHIPSATKVRMSLPLIECLADLPNIVGLKDSSGDLAFVFAVLDQMRDRPFVIFQGHDNALAPALLYGAHGGINSLANLVPEWFVHFVCGGSARCDGRSDGMAATHQRFVGRDAIFALPSRFESGLVGEGMGGKGMGEQTLSPLDGRGAAPMERDASSLGCAHQGGMQGMGEPVNERGAHRSIGTAGR